MTLNIQAVLPAQTFAVGEKVPLAMSIANPGPTPCSVINPRNAGPYLRFTVNIPGGGRRGVSMEVARADNVPPTIDRVRIPGGLSWDVEFDLSRLIELNNPGPYTVIVDFEYELGQKWTSLPLLFTVLPPAGTYLEIVPDDSAYAAQRTLIWVEKVGGTGRIMALPMERKTFAPAIVRGAVEIGRSHPDATPAASTYPAGLAYPDRWLAWVNRRRLLAFYWSLEPAWRLPPVPIELGFEPNLIHPLLAAAPPDQGRPTCLVGMHWASANGTGLAAYELGESGIGRLLAAVPVNGVVQDAWAACTADGNCVFVLAVSVENRTDVVAVTCPQGSGLQPPHLLGSFPGSFAAGDARLLADGAIGAGVIFQSGEEWTRATFRVTSAPARPEPVLEPIRPGSDTEHKCARLDSAGRLHWVFEREQVLYYMAGAAAEPGWSSHAAARKGSNFELSFRDQPPSAALAYYDRELGPVFVRF